MELGCRSKVFTFLMAMLTTALKIISFAVMINAKETSADRTNNDSEYIKAHPIMLFLKSIKATVKVSRI